MTTSTSTQVQDLYFNWEDGDLTQETLTQLLTSEYWENEADEALDQVDGAPEEVAEFQLQRQRLFTSLAEGKATFVVTRFEQDHEDYNFDVLITD